MCRICEAFEFENLAKEYEAKKRAEEEKKNNKNKRARRSKGGKRKRRKMLQALKWRYLTKRNPNLQQEVK